MPTEADRQRRRDAENRRRAEKGLPPVGSWGGHRAKAGRKTPKDARGPKIAAQPKQEAGPKPIDFSKMAAMLPEILELSERYSKNAKRTPENNPFAPHRYQNLHPARSTPPKNQDMAFDSAVCANGDFAANAWLGGEFGGLGGEGMLFLGYPYLSELAQRPEYRVMSETIADDCTRRWIDFDVTGDENENRRKQQNDPAGEAERQADPDERKKRLKAAGKTDKVKALKDDQDRLGVRDKAYSAVRDDGFFGRSHWYLNFGNITDDEEKMPIGDGRDAVSRGKIKKGSFKEIRQIEPVWVNPLNYNATNPLLDNWYAPDVWYVMGRTIHGSRIPTFIGHPLPDLLKPAYSFGGLSLSQMAKPYVDIWLTTRQSVAELIHSFSVMVLMTDLQTILHPGNAAALIARLTLFNALRDNQGVFALNKNTEDFKNVSASLAGLHELQAQSQEHMAAVSRIPLVKLTGISPSGLNATSEQEIEVYDDTISAYQNRFLRPNLTRVVNFEQLSLWGEIDPEITFRFEQLRDLTDAERAEKESKDAERDSKYVDMGALSPGDVRKRIVEDPDLPYTALDPDDVPDLLDEEESGLEPEGGRPDPIAGKDPQKESSDDDQG